MVGPPIPGRIPLEQAMTMSLREPNAAIHRLDSTPRAPRSISSIAAAGSGAQIDSAALLRGSREVLIRHGGEVYRLRHTRNDKLILTK